MNKNFKKLLSLFLVALMIFSTMSTLTLVSFAGNGEIIGGECGENLTWSLNTQTGVLNISGEGEMYDSNSEATRWNGLSEKITSVVIGDGVTSIGDYAFLDCSSLTSVTIPDSVTSIGSGAFRYCSSLTSVTIPDSVTSIGNWAFYGCTSLTSVTIGGGVTSIGDEAFYGCTSLTSVTIGGGVTSIGDGAFEYCSSLTSITIPDSVTSIGSWAFEGCSSLTSVTIPDSVTSISYGAFEGCSSLTSVTIPDSVTSIGNWTFSGCGSLTSVTIGGSVTSIGDDAFYGCTSLTSVTIGGSVTSIGDDAFYGCISLKDVYYSGGEEHWNEISIKGGNDCLLNATIHFCNHENAYTVEATIPEICDEIGYTEGVYCENCKKWISGHEKITLTHTDEDGDNVCDVCGNSMSDITVGEEKEIFVDERETVYLKFIPTVTGVYSFESLADSDTYGYIFDENKEALANNDDGGEDSNFKVEFTLEKNKTYYLGARYYDSDMSGSFNVLLTLVEAECGHENAYTVEAVNPEICGEIGYTEGVYCEDCEKWVSGHEEITQPHTDEDGDGVCDICGNSLSDIIPGEEKLIEVDEGETTLLKFIPTVSGRYKFEAFADADTYGYIYDSDMEIIADDDDGGEHNNFRVLCNLEKGKTYYLGARYYSSGNSGSFNVLLTLVEADCDHENTYTVEATIPEICGEIGYTEGVYCNDCRKWISGHEEIKIPHTDEDGDNVCDVCGKSVSDILPGEEKIITVPDIESSVRLTVVTSQTDSYIFKMLSNNGALILFDEDGNRIASAYHYGVDDYEKAPLYYNLERGKTYYLEIYNRYDEESEITISFDYNNIESISFTPESPFSLIEGADSISEWDDEHEDWWNYYYAPYIFRNGNKLVVTYKDGTEEVFENHGDTEDDIGFRSDDNVIYTYSLETEIPQSYENQLSAGEYMMKVSYGGKTCEVPVTIVPDMLEYITFTPVEPFMIMEKTGGRWTGFYDEDDEYVGEWYRYRIPSIFREGNYFTFHYSDERADVNYYCSENDEGEKYYSFDTKRANLWEYDFDEIAELEQSYYNQLQPGEHSFTFKIRGKEVEIPFTIFKDPVEGITYTPASPIVLTENVTGDWCYHYDEENDRDVEWFEYYISLFSDGDILTVSYNDGRGDVDYIYNNGDFISEDGDVIDDWEVKVNSNQSYNNQLSVGENTVKVIYDGFETDVPFTIVENPVESVSAVSTRPLYNDYDLNTSWWNEEGYYIIDIDFIEWTINFKDGTKFVGSTAEVYKEFSVMPEVLEDEFLSENGIYEYTVRCLGVNGTGTVEIVDTPDIPEEELPSAMILTKNVSIVVGEEVNIPIFKFNDKGYKHIVVSNILPEGLYIDNDGVLRGAAKKTNYDYSTYKIKVSWENSYKQTVIEEFYIKVCKPQDVIEIPENVQKLDLNTWVLFPENAGTEEWYSFVSPAVIGTLCRFDDGGSINIYDENGRPVSGGGCGDSELFGFCCDYSFAVGKTYYVKVSSDKAADGKFMLNSVWYMPSHEQSYKEEPDDVDYKLIEKNVEKTFEGEECTLWDVYYSESSGQLYTGDNLETPAYSIVASDTLFSKYPVYFETEKFEANAPVMNEFQGVYDPEDTTTWYDYIDEDNAAVNSHLKKDGEKEYRYDYQAFFYVDEPMTIEATIGYKIYIPAGCEFENDNYTTHVVRYTHSHTIVTDEAVPATCTQNGLTEGSHCSDCGEILVAQTEISALGHAYKSVVTVPTCTEDGYTTYTCTRCGDTYKTDITDANGHNAGQTVIENTVAATCTADGSHDEVTYCTVCSTELSREKKTDTKLGHSFTAYKESRAATCLENAEETAKCERCDVTDTREVAGSALGHDYVAVVTNPTCTEDGYTTYTCTRCGDTYKTDITDANGHNAGQTVIENAVAATCTADGSHDEVTYCTVCSTELSREKKTDTKLGHKFVTYTESKEATCLTNAEETAKCERCDVTNTRTVENSALGHAYKSVVTVPTCTEDGYTTYTCSRCNDTYTADITTKLGHTEVTDEAVSATCTAAGKTEGKHCSACGEVLKAQTVVKATGHTTDNGTVTKKVTCTANGTKTYKCTVCGEVLKTETIKATGHKEVTLKAVKATASKTGLTEGKKCSVCGKTLVAQKKTLAQVTNLKATKAAKTSIKLSWTKIAGAKYYKVEQSTDGKTWKKVKTVSTNSATISALKTGKKYQYRVTALDSTKKISSKASAVLKTGTLTTAPTVTLKSSKSKIATASWKKVTGASKYVVYKSTDGKKWTKVTTTTKLTYTLTKLTGGKKVYVKVTAVNAYSKESAASTAKSVTVKK